MKILIINGSPHKSGASARALTECAKVLEARGAEYELYQIGTEARHSCSGCGVCKTGGRCVYGDIDALAEAFAASDGIIIGTPTHYGGAPGNLLSVLSRLLYSKKRAAAGKPVAVIGVGRRACVTEAILEVEKFFRFSSCPIVSGCYPAILYADGSESAEYDGEGLQNMRSIAENLYWLASCVKCGKENGILPPIDEARVKTDVSSLSRKADR